MSFFFYMAQANTNKPLQDVTTIASSLDFSRKPLRHVRPVLRMITELAQASCRMGVALKANALETDPRSAPQVLKMEPEGQQSPRTGLSFLLPASSSAQHLSNSLSLNGSQETSSGNCSDTNPPHG